MKTKTNICQQFHRLCVIYLLPTLLWLLLPSVGQADSDYYTYITNNGTITITYYYGTGAVTIPSVINGMPVTSIASYACQGIPATSVTIPTSVTSIQDHAFEICQSLTNFTIPNSVTSLGDFVLDGCRSLTSVTIGSGITRIPNLAFAGCWSLPQITIPNSVTSIATQAFYTCLSLTNITIPNSVTSIEDWAFYACIALPSIAIPRSVSHIGDAAFADCTNLSAITVDVLNLYYTNVDGVLFNKTGTTLIQYPIGKSASFYAIPGGVTTIGYESFYLARNLTSVFITNTLTTLAERAFWYCDNMTNITIGNNVTSIGPGALARCTRLGNVTIPASVTAIADSAFYASTNLIGVFFIGNPPSLGGSSVFYGDNNATVYYLPGSVGWESTFGGLSTALWKPLLQTGNANFGVNTNGFGFNISWAAGMAVAVDVCTNLHNPAWFPLQTNTLTNGSFYFSDPSWTNRPGGFYRVTTVFLPPAPTITSVSPTSGSPAGGTPVSIIGKGFASGATVTFGSLSVTSSVVNSTNLRAMTPPGTNNSSVNVRVTNTDGQTAILTNGFTYQLPYQIVFYDNFNSYTNGNLAGTSQDALGQGTWRQTGAANASPIQVVNGAVAIGTSGQDVYAPLTSPISIMNGSTFYIGASVILTAAQANGDYFLNFTPTVGDTFSYRERLFAKSSGAGFVFGYDGSSGGTVNYSSTVLALNTPYRIVLAYTAVSGNTNDTFKLYVNPTDTLVEGNNSAYLTTGYVGIDPEQTTVSGINLRQGSASSAPSLTLDNLTVSTEFSHAATIAY